MLLFACLFSKKKPGTTLIQQGKIRNGLPCWLNFKESACQCRRQEFDPWIEKIARKTKGQPTPVFLPGKSLNPWSRKIPHVVGQLSSFSTATEPMCASAHEKPPEEVVAPQLESSPYLLQLEKALGQQQRHSTAKNK